MTVHFVCTGNTCRSPLAEALLRSMIVEREIADLAVTSAGVQADPGAPANPTAMAAARARGLELGGHRSRRFDPGSVRPGDLILVMEESHRRHVLAQGGFGEAAVMLLGGFAPGGAAEIGDPIGGPREAYDRCIDRLRACLEGLLTWRGKTRAG